MWGLWVSKGFGDSRSAAAMRTSLSSCKVSAAGELTPNPRLGGMHALPCTTVGFYLKLKTFFPLHPHPSCPRCPWAALGLIQW